MDLPLEVKVIVYDLLPPSKLSALLNFVGTGVYHSSVQLSLPLGPTDTNPEPQEWAFGGHDSINTTGVFSIPAGTAPQRMPGLRHYRTIDLGTAFGPVWSATAGTDASEESRPRTRWEDSSTSSLLDSGDPRRKNEDRDATEETPYRGYVDHASSGSSVSLPAVTRSDRHADQQTCDWEDDGGQSDGTEYMTRSQRRAWRIIQDLRRDPLWMGAKYDLLKRNCNTFTQELVHRLTGKPLPNWINRAAFIATSFPCIVPAGLIDDTEETVPTPGSASSPSITVDGSSHLIGDRMNIRIEPPRADRMDLGGRF